MNLRLFKFSNRIVKTYTSFFGVGLILVCFQNCSKGFTAGTAGDNAVGGMSSSPVTAVQQVANCIANAKDQKPSLTSLSVAGAAAGSALVLDIYSGMESAASGDKLGSNLLVSATKGFLDSAVESQNACALKTTIKVVCEVVNDATHPASFTHALLQDGSKDGSSLIGASGITGGSIANLALDKSKANSCGLSGAATISSGTMQVKLGRDATKGYAKCVEGSFYLKYHLEQTVNADNSTKTISVVGQDQYVQVNMHNSCWDEQKLSFTAVPQAKAGSAVAIDGNWSAVLATQAPLASDSSGATTNVGAVHLFNKDSAGAWSYHSSVQFSDAASNDGMEAISLKGDMLVISSLNRNSRAGAVVYFKYNTGTNIFEKMQEILAPNDSQNTSSNGEKFGKSLALSSDGILVVGAANYAGSAGRAYVYKLNSSSGLFEKFQDLTEGQNTASGLVNVSYSGFGTSVAISNIAGTDGATIVVGAPMAYGHEADGAGYANVYSYSSANSAWVLLASKAPTGAATSTNLSPAPNLRFGASVAVYNATTMTHVLIGAPGYQTTTGTAQGAAVYIENVNSGTVAKLILRTENLGEYGGAVAMNASGIYVGGFKMTSGNGLVEYFSYADLNTLKRTNKIFSTDLGNPDHFGSAIAVTDQDILIGSNNRSEGPLRNISASGAAYIMGQK